MKKSGSSPRKDKAISIRRHLPPSMRARYDAVRNSAPVKAAGMGAMVLVGIFGVLLATQTVSPTSSASNTNEVTVIQAVPGVTVSKDSENSTRLAFSVDVSLAGGSLNNNRLDGDDAVKYHTSNASSYICSTVDASYIQEAVQGTDVTLTAGGAHTATITDSVKVVCVRVKTKRNVYRGNLEGTIGHGFYSIAVNRTTTTPVVVVDLNSDGQYVARNSNRAVTVTGWAYVFVPDEASCTGLRFLKPPPAVLEFRDDVRTGNVWTPSVAEKVTPPNRYICFSGSTDSFTAGIGSKQITTSTPTQTALRITLRGVTQNGSVYTFSSNKMLFGAFHTLIRVMPAKERSQSTKDPSI